MSKDLVEEILKLSNAPTWEEGSREWKLEAIYFADDPVTCLCGKSPIIEGCVLRNSQNNKTAEVENSCVAKLFKADASTVFRGLEKIILNDKNAVSAELIERCFKSGVIFAADRRFYLDTRYKKELTPKMVKWRKEINQKIVKRFIKK